MNPFRIYSILHSIYIYIYFITNFLLAYNVPNYVPVKSCNSIFHTNFVYKFILDDNKWLINVMPNSTWWNTQDSG